MGFHCQARMGGAARAGLRRLRAGLRTGRTAAERPARAGLRRPMAVPCVGYSRASWTRSCRVSAGLVPLMRLKALRKVSTLV